MRICLVNPIAPPAGGSRPERTAQVAAGLAAAGHEITIVKAALPAGFGPRDNSLLAPVEKPGISLVELPCGRPARLTYARGGRARLLTRIAGEAFWPDWWVGFGLRAARWIASHSARFDVLLASAFPWTSVLCAWRVHRSTGLPWLADYGDPWSLKSTADGSAWRATADTLIEKRLLATAARVIVTTPATRDLFIDGLGVPASRVAVVPAGIPQSEPRPIPPAGSVRLLHAGQIYGPRASVLPFMRAFARFRAEASVPVEITWCGPVNRAAEFEAVRVGVTTYIPFADQQQIARFETETHAEVVFGNHGGSQVPAKIWRGLGSGRPLFAVVADEKDALLRVDELRGRAIVCRNEDAAILDGLRELGAFVEGHESPALQAERTPLATWSDRALEYADLLEQAVRSPRPRPRRGYGLRATVLAASATGLGLRFLYRLR